MMAGGSAQPVVVAGVGHGAAQQLLVLVHPLDKGGQEQQEPGVLTGGGAGAEEVHARVGGQGPVVVLTGAVDPGEGLFVEQAHHVVPPGHLLHDLHGQLVVVAGGVGVAVDGGQLVLGGGDLVVLGLGQDAQLPQLLIQLLHVGGHPGLDGAEVVVLQLLSLGGLGSEEGAAGEQQVLPPVEDVPVDEEVLLLGAHLADDPLHVRVPEQPQHPHRLAGELLHGAQQGGFFIQGLSAVGAKDGGDTETAVLDEGEGGGVPGGVAPGLEGRSEASGGEGGGVRLPPDQLLAGKLHEHPAGALGCNEAVVLFSGNAGHRLEPVGIVGSAPVHGPVFHLGGHLVGGFQGEGSPLLHTFFPRSVAGIGQALLHNLLIEDHAAKLAGYVSTHRTLSFRWLRCGLPRRFAALTLPKHHSCSVPSPRDHPHCSPPTPGWASRSPPPSPPAPDNTSRRSPGTKETPW